MKLKVTHNVNVEFGKIYRDTITGFEGKCTGTARYISGCDQVLLSPPIKESGYQESQWFDDVRLIDVEAENPVIRSSERGGPQSNPAPAK